MMSMYNQVEDSRTSRIIFLPHCSKCGAVIKEEIEIEKDINIARIPNKDPLLYPSYHITPARCKECGREYECVEVDTTWYEKVKMSLKEKK